MNNKFGYPKYVYMSWDSQAEYQFVPYYKNAGWLTTTTSRNITMQPGDVYEFVTITPGYVSNKNAVMFGKLNPTLVSDYTSRYGADLISTINSTAPHMLGLLSTKITTSDTISYKACGYSKMDFTTPDDIETLSQYMQTYSGNITSDKNLYLADYSRCPYMSAVIGGGIIYEKTLSTVYICKLTNNSQNTVTINIATKIVNYSIRVTTSTLIKSNDKVPISFYFYLLDKMRDFSVILIDPANFGDFATIFNGHMSVSLTEICKKWYDLTFDISTDVSALINFIVFYLFYNGKQIPIFEIWAYAICSSRYCKPIYASFI